MTPRHTLLALLVVVIWGLNFLAIDFGLDDVPPLLFLAMRFAVVAIPAVFLLKPPDIGWRNILLIGMTGLAIVVVGHGQTAAWLPVVVLLGGSLSWAIGNVLSRRAKAAASVSLVVWSGLVVPIPAFLLSLAIDTPAVVFDALAHLSLDAILSTVYTAVLASLVGYGIWNHLLARYPTSAVVPFTLLVPIVGILAAWLVVNEQPTLSELIGGAVMLVGLAIAVVVWRRRAPDVLPV